MRILFSVCAIGLVLNGAHAQITSSNSDRHFIAGARAASMADAYAGEAYDVMSMYTNPATLPVILRSTVIMNYSLEQILSTDNIMNENVAAPVPLRDDLSLGLGATVSHVGHIRPSSPLSGLKYVQYGFAAGVGWVIAPFFSIGADVDARYGVADGETQYSAFAALGAYYSPSPEIGYGISLQGLGDGLEYSLNSQQTETVINKSKLDRSLQVGISWRFRDNKEDPLLTVMLANQKILGLSGLVYKGGIEYMPFPFIALRGGYWVGQASLAPKFGLGLRLAGAQVDYGASPSRLEPVFHQFSLSFDIGQK